MAIGKQSGREPLRRQRVHTADRAPPARGDDPNMTNFYRDFASESASSSEAPEPLRT